jgi:hypothetical protein
MPITSGATGALKVVGEFFPWSKENYFLYTMENQKNRHGMFLNGEPTVCLASERVTNRHGVFLNGKSKGVEGLI